MQDTPGDPQDREAGKRSGVSALVVVLCILGVVAPFAIGAYWIWDLISPPEKKVDFVPSSRVFPDKAEKPAPAH